MAGVPLNKMPGYRGRAQGWSELRFCVMVGLCFVARMQGVFGGSCSKSPFFASWGGWEKERFAHGPGVDHGIYPWG